MKPPPHTHTNNPTESYSIKLHDSECYHHRELLVHASEKSLAVVCIDIKIVI